MPCTYVKVGGSVAIVCGSRRARRHYCACGATSGFQCDWKVGRTATGEVKTCDRHLCGAHALEVAPDKHLCHEHQQAHEAWKAARVSELPTTEGEP